MQRAILILLVGLLLSSNVFAGHKEFKIWLNSFGLSKPIVQDKIFYMGITPTGEPNKLLHIFRMLVDGYNRETVYSEDKRYFARYGCKPHDCGNKGFLWIDLKKKVAIGVIIHSFWEKLDFNDHIDDQIFIFSNFFEDSKDFPDEFIKTYSNFIKKIEIEPSLYRFLNSKNELNEIPKIK